MKNVIIRQLETGDILYYVHKPNDKYVVDEIKLGKSNISQFVPNTIKLPIKNSNLTYYLYDKIEKLSQPIPLYINTKYGLRQTRSSENKFLFAGERAAMSKMHQLNDELELASELKSYLKYQDGFLHEYNKRFTESEHHLYLQTTEQLKTMYGWSDSDLHDIVSQNNSTFELRTTDPEKAHQLFSLGLPRTGNENLWLLLRGRHNIHLIVTNKVVTDGRVSTHVIDEIDNTFSVIEHQSKYYFNGVSWMEQPDNLVHQKAVSHLKGAEFDELQSHVDEPTYELVCRNLIELYTEKPNSDIWLKIANRMLHEQWTRHHNLDIQDGSFAALLEDEHVANSPALAKTFDNIAMELANNISNELKSLNQS